MQYVEILYMWRFPETNILAGEFMIVFASGKITIAQMAKAGLWLNLLGVVIVTLLSYLLLGFVFEL